MLKERLTSAPTLAFPNFDQRFPVQTDVSDIGMGAILTQEMGGAERVIAYISRQSLCTSFGLAGHLKWMGRWRKRPSCPSGNTALGARLRPRKTNK